MGSHPYDSFRTVLATTSNKKTSCSWSSHCTRCHHPASAPMELFSRVSLHCPSKFPSRCLPPVWGLLGIILLSWYSLVGSSLSRHLLSFCESSVQAPFSFRCAVNTLKPFVFAPKLSDLFSDSDGWFQKGLRDSSVMSTKEPTDYSFNKFIAQASQSETERNAAKYLTSIRGFNT